MIDDLPASSRIVGTKQVIKAVNKGVRLRCVYVAEDADDKVRDMVISACGRNNVEVEVASCMSDLGAMCGIDVGAACVAVLEL